MDISNERPIKSSTQIDDSSKAGAFTDPIIDQDELKIEAAHLEGLTLADYATKNQLSESEVWKLLRQGELVGRTHCGKLIIYPEPTTGLPPLEKARSSQADKNLPPLPHIQMERSAVETGGFLSVTGERSSSPEIALLIDHLSLAKEENREILKMTQESIRKVSEMSDSIVEMKDAVIDAKDAELHALKEQLKATDSQNAKLRQDNEDLNMLARSLAEDS